MIAEWFTRVSCVVLCTEGLKFKLGTKLQMAPHLQHSHNNGFV